MENYVVEEKTINLLKANIYALLSLIPIVLLYGLPYYFLWNDKYDLSAFVGQIEYTWYIRTVLLFLFIGLLGVILHELIHGIVWAIFAKKGWKSIKFGILWKMMTPYCHCKEPLKVKHYILGAISPALILGLIPAILANILGHWGMLLFAIFFTMAAIGDFMSIYLIRNEDKDAMVQDHPSEAGYFIHRKVEE